jgi:hypothetical protein
MEQSDKHGARLDEQLKHDTQSLTRGAPVEARSQPGRLQDDLVTNPADRRDVPSPPGSGIDPASADQRAELAMAIQAATFPADPEALRAAALSQHPPGWVLRALGTLPGGERFENVQAVWRALGGETEGPHP